MPAGIKTKMTTPIRLAVFLLLCALCGTTLACKGGSAPPPGMSCCGDAIVSGAGSSNDMECCSGK